MTMVGGSDSARAVIRSFLDRYSLGSLTEWAYQRLTAGQSVEQIMLDLPQTPEYQARFPAMAALAERGRVMTEEQYKNYEETITGIMRRAGLPSQFYDQPADFAKLLMSEVSPAEAEQRISVAYRKVAEAPPDVQQAFGEMYGPGSNDALAAFMLDPDRALPLIEKQVAAAQVKAAGGRYGLGISTGLAEQVAAAGPTEQVAQQIRQAGQLRPLSEQTILESQTGTGVTTEELVKGTTGLTSPDRIKKAMESRVAQFQGTGGAVQSQEGVIGLGGSQQ